MASSRIRVVLIDDHAHVHQAVITVLNQVQDIALVGHGSNGSEALQLCEELQPDLILMDVVMPGMNGAEATKLVRSQYPDIKILVLSSFQDDQTVYDMLANGAMGYVLKGSLAHDLVDTIRATCSGKLVFSPEIAHVLFNPIKDEKSQAFGLTQRELEILKLMTEGLNNGEIAGKLVISQSTVKFHINNILQKIGVETRAEALVVATKNNLV
jgi:two-component system, NarL family, response regulator LiaR